MDIEEANAARERAAKLIAEGLSSDETIEAKRALRRAEITIRIKRKLEARGHVLRILTDEEE